MMVLRRADRNHVDAGMPQRRRKVVIQACVGQAGLGRPTPRLLDSHVAHGDDLCMGIALIGGDVLGRNPARADDEDAKCSFAHLAMIRLAPAPTPRTLPTNAAWARRLGKVRQPMTCC